MEEITLKDYSGYPNERIVCKKMIHDVRRQMRDDGFEVNIMQEFFREVWRLDSVEDVTTVIEKYYIIT
jgi:hypothetical protein